MDLTGVIITAASVVSSAIAWVGRMIWKILDRQEKKIDAIAEEGRLNGLRNCVHHGVLFDHLDIPRSVVSEAEQAAGVSPKGHV